MHVIKLLLKFLRPMTTLLLLMHFVFFYLCLSPHFAISLDLFYAALAIALCYISATSINDLSDEQTDAINLKNATDRPLVEKSASRRQVWQIFFITSVLTVVMSSLIDWRAGCLSMIMIMMCVIYSWPPVRISSRGAWAQYLLPLVYCAFPATLASFVAQKVSPEFILTTCAMHLIFVGRLFLKDIRDEKGDRITKKLTFVVRHSAQSAIVWSAFWTVIGTIGLSIAIFVNFGLNGWVVFGFCGLSLLGQMVALWQASHARSLDVKLSFIGIYGRWISMKIFFYIVIMALHNYQIAESDKIIVSGAVIFLIIVNIMALYENIKTEKLTLGLR